jgi:hypothetical protein
MKTVEEFIKFTKELPLITYTKLTKEEFVTLMKPVMCDICRRIFNPTEEERQSLKKTLEKFDSEDWTWELIINHKD